MKIEVAVSARSKCRFCGLNVSKGEVRAAHQWHKSKPMGYAHLACLAAFDEEGQPIVKLPVSELDETIKTFEEALEDASFEAKRDQIHQALENARVLKSSASAASSTGG